MTIVMGDRKYKWIVCRQPIVAVCGLEREGALHT